jgi:hypothetical protein
VRQGEFREALQRLESLGDAPAARLDRARALQWTGAYERADELARALVDETLMLAEDPAHEPGGDVSTRMWIHRLLRRGFHSIERDRSYRRSTSAAVTELGYARKRLLAAQAEAEERGEILDRRSA